MQSGKNPRKKNCEISEVEPMPSESEGSNASYELYLAKKGMPCSSMRETALHFAKNTVMPHFSFLWDHSYKRIYSSSFVFSAFVYWSTSKVGHSLVGAPRSGALIMFIAITTTLSLTSRAVCELRLYPERNSL